MIIHVHNGNGHVRVTPSTFSLYLGPVYTFIHRRAPPSTHIMSDFFSQKYTEILATVFLKYL